MSSRLSQLCLPLWFHLTIVHKDVQADCLNHVYHYGDSFDYCSQGCTNLLFQLCLQLWFHLTIAYKDVKQIVSIMFTTMISFNYCSQGCTSRLSQLCLPLWFHLTIGHKDVQADCLIYVFHYDFI